MPLKLLDTKSCSRCHISYPRTVEFFYLRPRSKDGFVSYCKYCARKMAQDYRNANREKILAKKRDIYREQKEKILKRVKRYAQSKQGKITRSKYKKNNRKRIREVRQKYESKRWNEDLQFKLTKQIRNRIRQALNGNYKSANTIKLIGCSIKSLKEHIESQFLDGMTWDNHGDWHIDHKIPCAAFDLSKPCEQRSCFNFKNIQPLWAEDNIKKNATI